MLFNDLNVIKWMVKKVLFHRQFDLLLFKHQLNLLFEKLFSRIYKCNKMVLLLTNYDAKIKLQIAHNGYCFTCKRTFIPDLWTD